MILRRNKVTVHKRESIWDLAAKLIINVAALLVVEELIPGFMLMDIKAAIIAAIVIGVVNTFIRPIIQLVALPLSILTLGLTAFLINVFLLMIVARITPGFEIDSFLTAAISSILLSLVNAFLHKLATIEQ